MGEIADDHIDRMLAEGYFPLARPWNKWDVTCMRCSKRGLKWRMDENHWRLFENARGERNKLKLHECNPPSADDFDVVES